ncbi:hypothetical protein [Vibrio sp. ER1A]|uniref:hypothetical protein n=1 Tax=Vibrio sp. ER1A TaxID=1517681 RepID=UPI0004DCCEAF|nr:hypothetical protein [Vibrio sp. ER1A]KFA99601.1 hypothetical protein HW45_02755 [Vibrio sp. ER1A]
MNNQRPIDKGRLVYIAERYQTNTIGQDNQPMTKNRYASVGRATLWPNKPNSNMPNIEIEIDTMPINQSQSPLKLFVFWDSEDTRNQ